MYKSLILPLAKQDIREAAIWYNKRQNGLGKRFIDELRKKVRFIRQNPTASVARYNDVRTTVLNIFPYMIHYLVDESTNSVVIIAVIHTSLNPELWETR